MTFEISEPVVSRAVENIWKKIAATGNDSSTNTYGLRRVQKAAARYDRESLATGLVVEYADGSTDVFHGETSDPYRGSDWAFVDINDSKVLKGYKFALSDTDSERVSAGIQSVKSYQCEMSENLVGSYPVFAEGPDEFVSEKMVISATVL